MNESPLIRYSLLLASFLLLGGVAIFTRSGDAELPKSSATTSVAVLPRNGDAVAPLPQPPALDAARVALGERLFREVRLSADDTIACVSCHDLGRGGVDRLPVSVGVGGARGGINAPTVFNSSLNFVQFWDGRAATLEEQAAGPIHNPSEMASDWAHVLPKLNADERYRSQFTRIYSDGITANNVVDAIATFERSLATPDSRFDLYLRGEPALNEDEIAGYRHFRELGCTACHQGVRLGGNMYQKFGVLRDYFAGRQPTKDDMGRFNVTGLEEDKHVFKVPSLRNVALTAPYFHDGSASTLEQAVQIMGRYQLGRELESKDVRQIAAFLRSLTGQWNGKPLD
jgi:cytochrome c peroxidase